MENTNQVSWEDYKIKIESIEKEGVNFWDTIFKKYGLDEYFNDNGTLKNEILDEISKAAQGKEAQEGIDGTRFVKANRALGCIVELTDINALEIILHGYDIETKKKIADYETSLYFPRILDENDELSITINIDNKHDKINSIGISGISKEFTKDYRLSARYDVLTEKPILRELAKDININNEYKFETAAFINGEKVYHYTSGNGSRDGEIMIHKTEAISCNLHKKKIPLDELVKAKIDKDEKLKLETANKVEQLNDKIACRQKGIEAEIAHS